MDPTKPQISPSEQPGSSNRGQTLAEFAISLPILLLLLFGILEFGRLFQSWVTIQNAARQAARYAITGAYNEDKYNMDALLPCKVDAVPAERDTLTLPLWDTDPTDAILPEVEIDIYKPASGILEEDSEHLYRTWYGQGDCFPDETSEQQRKDVLRLASIYDEARIGAAGLLKEDTLLPDNVTQSTLQSFLFNSVQNPSPRREDRGWFDVSICSTRTRVHPPAFTQIVDNWSDPNSGTDNATLRFHTVDAASPDIVRFPDANACVLKEQPKNVPEAAVIPDNWDLAWMDAGGPGDRITITVTYNHPLITPLGLAPFVRLQARRSAVNESFRVTNAERALGPSGATGPSVVTATPGPPTATFTATNTPTQTYTPSATHTSTSTPLPPPFTCDQVTADSLRIIGNSVYIRFTNDNVDDTELLSARLVWRADAILNDYPNAYVGFMALDEEIFWTGNDGTPPTDSSDPADGTFFASAYRGVPGNGATVDYKGVFVNGPPVLASSMQPWDFAGTRFVFDNPVVGQADCVIDVDLPPPPPTATPIPAGFVPSATFTPDCASSHLRVDFVSFDSLGDVRLQVTNNRQVTSPMTGFNIVWPARPGLRLSKVVAGGQNANDLPATGGTGVVVWQNFGGGDDTPPTNSTNAGDGQWLTNYTFMPNSVTFLHLDFTGVGPSTLQVLGISPSDFNGTRFEIWCGSVGNPNTGGGGSGGGGGAGTIFLSELPTPVPTQPPQPTSTPGPTLTPSKTFTPGPPTNTWTPAPPTKTFTPQPTARPSNTPPPTSTPTDVFGGSQD